MTRIVSFLPAGSEILCALGGGGDLVGRSHECDYPPQVLELPIVSRPALRLDDMTQTEIDQAVAQRLGSGESLYEVDELLLRDLEPDIIITQDLCQVCAPSGNELTRAIRDLPVKPDVVWLSPQSMADIEQNILKVGEASGRVKRAESLVASNRERVDRVVKAVYGAERRRVAFLEWTDPLFSAGHWVPEMIEIAGGHDPLGRSGADSIRMSWEDVRASNPELIVVSPCGYRLEQAVDLAEKIQRIEGVRVIAVDANSYFARPGPRIAEGVELLAHIFHPDLAPWPHSHRPWLEIS